MARVYYSSTAVGRNTSTTVSYSDQVSLTFTGTANKQYLMLWGCLLDNNSTTADVLARLYHDTAATAFNTFNFEAQDTTDNYQVAAAWIYTASASPTPQTFSVEFSHEASGRTAGCQDGYLIALELGSTDLTSTLLPEQTTTSSLSFVDVGTSLTLSAGDYLLLVSSEINSTAVNADTQWRIHNGTSAIATTGGAYIQDTTNYTPWWMAVRVQPASTTVYKMQFQSSNAAVTVRARNNSLIALDLSQFADVIYGEDLSESNTTSSTAQTKLSVTDTPLAMDYLQIFAAALKGDGTTNSSYIDYTRAGSPISVEAEREPNNNVEWEDHGYSAISTLTATSTTWTTRYRAESVTSAARIKNTTFTGLGLGDAPTTYTITSSLNAAISKTSTATASLNAAVQKAQTAAASLNAAVQKGQTQTASVDAAIQIARTASADLDAVLQKTMMETADMDAVIQKAQTADAAIDAAIQISQTVTAQLSAAIQAARTATASLDAYIEIAASGVTITTSLDAAIQASRTVSASLDAYITTAEVVAEVISGGGGGWKKRKADFTDWWVEWSKARKMRRDKKLAKEVEQYREQAAPRVLAALDAEEVERIARLEAELRAVEYGYRELQTRQAIDRMLKQIAAVREMLWQAELEADDEDVLLLVT